jgi:hypothetical protein
MSVKPPAARMRFTRSGSAKDIGPGSSGPGRGGSSMNDLATMTGFSIHGFSDSARQQASASRPPGFVARPILAKAASASRKNITPKREKTRSKAASPKSWAAASASTKSTAAAPGRVRACSSMGRETSTPITLAPVAAMSMAVPPQPQPMSSTVSPASGRAAAST